MARLKNTSTLALSPFDQQLKKVLKWFNNPARIGQESPLASAYFLGGLAQHPVDNNAFDNVTARGEVLCHEIRRAAQTLWEGAPPDSFAAMREALLAVRNTPGTGRYAYVVLELRCFQDFLRPKRTADIWLDEAYLPGSQSEHYRDYDAAIVLLSQALLSHLHPALRGEPLPQVPMLVGYESQITQLTNALADGHSIGLTGPSGVGKTAVAAAVLQKQRRPVFWYTIRATLNDHLPGILFALGHFLHKAGASQLWQLVVASGSMLDNYDVALAAMRADLAMLPQPLPIFSFDELELLTPVGNDESDYIHAQVHTFLESLTGEATVLLVGQAQMIPTKCTVTLSGLPSPQIEQLFAHTACPISRVDAEQLYHATGGNPRLLALMITLYQRGDTIEEIVSDIGTEPAIEPLFHRIYQRLTAAEQQQLQRCAVFRRPAPIDGWPNNFAVIRQLIRKRLLIADGQGGVELLPALRPPLSGRLTPAERRTSHRAAAQIRLLHAEYTAAAYHLVQGEQPADAIQLWFVHREQEIRHGQAEAAFALFRSLDSQPLQEPERQALAIIQAELHKLRGEFEAGLADLNRVSGPNGEMQAAGEVLVQIEGLRGEFLEMLGDPDGALQRYEEALQQTSRLLSRQVSLHHRRSMLFVRRRDLSAAWQEVQLADCQLQIVRGILADEEGRYSDAQTIFAAALAQAEALDDQATMALAERHLANAFGRLQELANAERYAHRAIARYEDLGDSFNVARVYDNLAFSYLHGKAVVEGIAAATKALQFFQAAKSVYYSAIVATNLAEAYFDSGDLDTRGALCSSSAG